MAGLKRSVHETETAGESKSSKRVRSAPERRVSKPEQQRRSISSSSENDFEDFSSTVNGEVLNEDRELKKGIDAPPLKSKLQQGAGRNATINNIAEGDKKFKLTTSSAEAHAAQRKLAKERKDSKPNADLVARSKKIWERLRRKSHVEKEERKELVAELYAIINGRVRDFVFKHDSVRVVQCALKYANKEQRLNITRELQTDMRALVESKYGKFMVAKIVVEGDQEIRDLVIPEFYGHVRKLINHPEAAWILDDIYRGVATPIQKAHLLREWYGAEFALENRTKDGILKTSDKPTSDLSKILSQSPEKRKPIMTYLHQMINQLVQKKMTGFTMLHDAMLQYFTNLPAGSEEAGEFLENLKSDLDDESGGGDLLKNLAFTQSGSRVVCLALAYGTAKDRKLILRVYKEVMEMMALDAHAWRVLLVALEMTDDTKASAKAVYSELLHENVANEDDRAERISALLSHRTACIPLLYPLASNTKWLIPADSSALLKDVLAIRETTSKKAPATRDAELAKYSAEPLLTAVSKAADVLVQSTTGCQAITEILLSSPSHDATPEGGVADAAVKAVTALCAGDTADESHISRGSAAGKMLRTLCQGGRFDTATKTVVRSEPDIGFAPALYASIGDHVLGWATGPSSFVVVALAEGGLDEGPGRKGLLGALEKGRKQLQKAAEDAGEDGRVNAGAKILLEKLT